MKKSDLTITVLFDKAPGEVFAAINNVRGWWSSGLEGNSEKLNDVFVYRYKDMHRSTQQLVEVIPDKKVKWLVSDSYLSFITRKNEWDGTTVTFDVQPEGSKTRLIFTHTGLTPDVECFEACSGGWNHYILQSLVPLVNMGKGNPDEVH